MSNFIENLLRILFAGIFFAALIISMIVVSPFVAIYKILFWIYRMCFPGKEASYV